VEEVAEQYVYGKLSGSAALVVLVGTSIFQGISRQGSDLPATVFRLVAAEDHNTQMNSRGATVFLYQVFIYDKSESRTVAHLVAQLIDTVLHGGSGTVDSMEVDSFRRSPFSETKFEEGGQIEQLVGGLYEVWVRPTS